MADRSASTFAVPSSAFNFVSADWDNARRTRRANISAIALGVMLIAWVGWMGASTGSEADMLRLRTEELADEVVRLANREREITGGITDLRSYAQARRQELYTVAGSDLDLAAAVAAVLDTVPAGVVVQAIKLEPVGPNSDLPTSYRFEVTGVGSTLSDPLTWRDRSLQVAAVVSPEINYTGNARADVRMTVTGGLRDEIVLPQLANLEAAVGANDSSTTPADSAEDGT